MRRGAAPRQRRLNARDQTAERAQRTASAPAAQAQAPPAGRSPPPSSLHGGGGSSRAWQPSLLAGPVESGCMNLALHAITLASLCRECLHRNDALPCHAGRPAAPFEQLERRRG